VNPPPGAAFYPFFTTRTGDPDFLQFPGNGCVWQEGGRYLPGTTNTFGGSSTTAYGPLLLSTYQAFGSFNSIQRYNNFRSIPISNPCITTSSGSFG
jgi:hypothetical protein